MSPPATTAHAPPRLRSSGYSRELRGPAERNDVAADWLTVQQVTDIVRAAGYPDSVDTIRRRIDAGSFGKQGEDWYRTESGYRMVRHAAVSEFIARRRQAE